MRIQIQYPDYKGKQVVQVFESRETPEIIIGRRDRITPHIDLTWEHTVSRDYHARIFADFNTWYIEAISSKSPVKLDGVTIKSGVSRPLPSSCKITVGNLLLSISHNQADVIPDGVISTRSVPGDPISSVSEKERLNALSAITEALADGGNTQLDRLLEVMKPLFPTMTACGIALYRDRDIVNPAFYPPGKAQISNRLAGQALNERMAFRWERKISDNSVGLTSLFGTTQAMYAPILRGFYKLGVLYIHTDREFNDGDLDLLRTISEIIGASEQFDPVTIHLRLPSVFISYSRHDTEYVKKLIADIRRQRVAVWYDTQIRAGEEWQPQLAQAIQQSDALALVMSPESLGSQWVAWEIEQARLAKKMIIPLLYQPCDDIPKDISKLQYIDLQSRYEPGVLELVERLYTLSGEKDTLSIDKPRVMRSPVSPGEKIRVLFVAANPRDTDQLRLGEEIRTIQERIRGGRFRDQFDTIQQGWAVRFSDLQQYLLEHKPHIVHFSGHGAKNGEIILENASGKTQGVTKKTLKLLFKALKDDSTGVRLVILNACYSANQAEAIAEEVDCVLGMTRSVSDPAAIEFAGSFYQALVFGKSVQSAFNMAGSAMSLTDEEETPLILTNDTDPNNIFFCNDEN